VTPIVLVVDDLEDNRELVSLVLGQAGYNVEIAVDGVDAVERARTVRPSVILMDLAMPNMDGFDATRAIRAMPELGERVHIIAFSAFADSVSVERALAAGCNEAIAKPCTPDRLVACIEDALRIEDERSAAG
jgi:CheY-like chemotaxis protein